MQPMSTCSRSRVAACGRQRLSIGKDGTQDTQDRCHRSEIASAGLKVKHRKRQGSVLRKFVTRCSVGDSRRDAQDVIALSTTTRSVLSERRGGFDKGSGSEAHPTAVQLLRERNVESSSFALNFILEVGHLILATTRR